MEQKDSYIFLNTYILCEVQTPQIEDINVCSDISWSK